jgi:TonB family protein
MTDSTARAERLDPLTSEAAFYTWEVAQKPVVVRLPLTLIDRLESEAVETFRSLSSRGSEIGGLLLGSAVPGSPAVVTVADYELIACDYSRGPLYRLSDADLGRFEQAIERCATGSGPRVMGYFRSHTRKGLSLDAEDLAFFEPRFLDPHQLVLLIRPFATKASTAGIFIRENGRVNGETSSLEFPFRSAELGARGGGEKSEPASPLAAPAAPPVQAPKLQSRAQIVPIASRREITLPEPALPLPAPPMAVERVETAVPPAQKSGPAVDKEKEKAAAAQPKNAPAAEKEKVAAAAQSKSAPAAGKEKAAAQLKGAAAAGKAADAPAAEPESKPAPKAEALVESAPPVRRKNKKLRLTVAAALGMLVLVGGSLVVYPTLRNRIFQQPAAVPQDSSPLSLRVERTAGGMLLTWNRDLPVIQQANKVVLSISDGDRHENIELDPNQVRTGSILYPPITQDVSFQMEVTAPHQSKTTSESLRVLDPRPSPLADPSDVASAGAARPGAAKPVANAIATPETAAAEDPKPQEEAPVPHSAVPLKPFNTESLAQRLRPVSPADLPEAPAEVRVSASTPGSLPGIVATQPSLPPPPKSAASATPSPSAPTAPVAIGGQLRPAEVISRKEPEYPAIAMRAGASGLVEMEATIGADGKVKNARVVKGNAMLHRAALDAVLQWRYKPATLNGKPVESPVEIKLNFVPH